MGRQVGVALVLTILGAGCGETRLQVFPVKGQLLWEGQPAAGAVVYFHLTTETVDAQNPAKGRRPWGRVAADGTFELTTYVKNDGAPKGRYRVSVYWVKGAGNDEATPLLPESFMNPATSGLPTVEQGLVYGQVPP